MEGHGRQCKAREALYCRLLESGTDMNRQVKATSSSKSQIFLKKSEISWNKIKKNRRERNRTQKSENSTKNRKNPEKQIKIEPKSNRTETERKRNGPGKSKFPAKIQKERSPLARDAQNAQKERPKGTSKRNAKGTQTERKRNGEKAEIFKKKKQQNLKFERKLKAFLFFEPKLNANGTLFLDFERKLSANWKDSQKKCRGRLN
jgi:hypothetical protein